MYASLLLLNDLGSSGPQVQAAYTDQVKFQTFEIDESLIDIMWCGPSNEVILTQTAQGTIYRSRDKGESWTKLHSMMRQAGSVVSEAGMDDIGKV